MRSLKWALVACGLALAGPALAQSYPNRPVRVVLPFAAGSSIDVATRIVFDDMQRRTGAIIVVEARPGALGAIGTEAVARAAPDGYTVMPSSSAGPASARPHATSAHFNERILGIPPNSVSVCRAG